MLYLIYYCKYESPHLLAFSISSYLLDPFFKTNLMSSLTNILAQHLGVVTVYYQARDQEHPSTNIFSLSSVDHLRTTSKITFYPSLVLPIFFFYLCYFEL